MTGKHRLSLHRPLIVHRPSPCRQEPPVTPAAATPDFPATQTGPGEQVRFLIIGAGFSGLGAAIRLQAAGHTDLVVLERAEDVGGTWRDNIYPGCRCDVQSNLYSYLVRAQAGLERDLPVPARTVGVPAEDHRTIMAFAATFDSGTRSPTRAGTRRPAAGRSARPGHLRRQVPDRRRRLAGRAVAARHPRYRVIQRHDHALGSLG